MLCCRATQSLPIPSHALIELLAGMEHYGFLRAKGCEFTIGRFSRAAFEERLQEALLFRIARGPKKH